MSERSSKIELQPNGLPVELKDWTMQQLEDSYFYLEGLRPSELNAGSMLNISGEIDSRNVNSLRISKE
jgi:hypothetical protein